jgi:hypothetical protein
MLFVIIQIKLYQLKKEGKLARTKSIGTPWEPVSAYVGPLASFEAKLCIFKNRGVSNAVASSV